MEPRTEKEPSRLQEERMSQFQTRHQSAQMVGAGPNSLFRGHELFPNSLATDHNALLKDPREEIENHFLKGRW